MALGTRGTSMILNKTGAAAAFLLLAAALAAPATAAESKPSAPGLDARSEDVRTADEVFAALDEDGNGRVDRAEWQIRKMAIFYVRDENHDLQLGRDELPKLGREPFGDADLDEDGSLSGYEFNQATFSRFEHADADDDGAVSAGEFRTYMATGGNAR